MPIYEYQCEACSRRTEELQKMSDPPLETCSECGGALRRLISAPAVQFKGTGWYVTDYAKSGSKDGGAKSSSSSDGGSGDGGSTGGESKADRAKSGASSSDSSSASSSSTASASSSSSSGD